MLEHAGKCGASKQVWRAARNRRARQPQVTQQRLNTSTAHTACAQTAKGVYRQRLKALETLVQNPFFSSQQQGPMTAGKQEQKSTAQQASTAHTPKHSQAAKLQRLLVLHTEIS